MKKAADIFLRAAFVSLLFPAIPVASAADKNSKKEPTPRLIRISVLMVSMPEEKFIALLPDLLDQDKIEMAIPGLLEAVKRKEITLEGYPMLVTKSGHRAVTEAVTEFDERLWQQVPNLPTTPTAFETRNIGVTFEVEPVIRQDGRIDLHVEPQQVEFLGYETFVLPKKKKLFTGIDADPHQPIFFCMNTTTALTLRSGQHVLLAVHKKARPEGTVEIFIIGAEVLKVGSPDTAPSSGR